MARTRVSQTVTRPTRTGVQGGAAYAILEFLVAFDLVDLTGRQWAVSMLILTAVVSFAQTALENRAGVGFLRAVPPRDEPVDVPGDDGHITATEACLIALTLFVMFFALWLTGTLPGAR